MSYGHGQLGALGGEDPAIAELLVEDPVAPGIGAGLGVGDRQQLAFTLDDGLAVDGGCGPPAVLGPPPAGRVVAGAEGRGLVPAARRRLHAGPATEIAGLGDRLHMGLGQLVDEAAGQLAGPSAIDEAVGGEADPRRLPRPGQADIGEAPFLLQALLAGLV